MSDMDLTKGQPPRWVDGERTVETVRKSPPEVRVKSCISAVFHDPHDFEITGTFSRLTYTVHCEGNERNTQ